MADRDETLIVIIPNKYSDPLCVRYYAMTLTYIVYCGKSENYLWPSHSMATTVYILEHILLYIFLSILHFFVLFLEKK